MHPLTKKCFEIILTLKHVLRKNPNFFFANTVFWNYPCCLALNIFIFVHIVYYFFNFFNPLIIHQLWWNAISNELCKTKLNQIFSLFSAANSNRRKFGHSKWWNEKSIRRRRRWRIFSDFLFVGLSVKWRWYTSRLPQKKGHPLSGAIKENKNDFLWL